MPHVPRGDRRHPQAPGRLLGAGQGRHGRPHEHAARPGGPAGRPRVHPHQPPARLSGLRQGRRVPAAGQVVRLGRGHQPIRRSQAPFREAARALPADRDRSRALHPLLPLRALQPGGQRGLPADPPGARRRHVRRDLRRAPVRRAVQRQHHRAVPRRRAHLAPLPLPREAVGHRAVGLDLHALPGAVQRELHRPRRARPARPAARQRRRRRRLAVRQGPLRLPGDPRRRAHHPAAAARRRRAAPGALGARARDGRRHAGEGRRAHRRPGRRRDEQRGGLAAPAARPRHARLGRRRLARGRDAAARAPPRARRPRTAGLGRRPRVRPRRARARHRARRRRTDPRPAHPQGRAPPRRAAAPRDEPALVARRARRLQRALRAGGGRGAARRARRRARRRRPRRRPPRRPEPTRRRFARSPTGSRAPARTW